MGKSDLAYEYLRNAIENKEYFPGSRIIEEDIVKKIGVSRTSVRKAIAKLEYEGVVDSTTGQGVSVTKFNEDDIRSIFAVREPLEVGAFKLAMDNITPEAIERMRKYNKGLEELSEDFSINDYVELNRNFHMEIVKAAKSKYFEKYLTEVFNTIAVCLLFYNDVPDDERSIGYHNEIIEALEEKDLEKGKAAIRKDNTIAMEDSHFLGTK